MHESLSPSMSDGCVSRVATADVWRFANRSDRAPRWSPEVFEGGMVVVRVCDYGHALRACIALTLSMPRLLARGRAVLHPPRPRLHAVAKRHNNWTRISQQLLIYVSTLAAISIMRHSMRLCIAWFYSIRVLSSADNRHPLTTLHHHGPRQCHICQCC